MSETPHSRDEAFRAVEIEISVTARRIRRAATSRARTIHPELPATSYAMLLEVRERGSCRPSDLAELFSIDKGAVSRLVNGLEEMGLLARSPDPLDGRAQLLTVTDVGQQRMDEVTREGKLRWAERLSTWDYDDLASFAAMLRRYNTAIDEVPISG